MARAVATCSPTMTARYGDSGADTFRSLAHDPPISARMSTLWPRLDSGNSSVMPWISPTSPASPYVRCDMPAPRSPPHARENHLSRTAVVSQSVTNESPGGALRAEPGPGTCHGSRRLTRHRPVSSHLHAFPGTFGVSAWVRRVILSPS